MDGFPRLIGPDPVLRSGRPGPGNAIVATRYTVTTMVAFICEPGPVPVWLPGPSRDRPPASLSRQLRTPPPPGRQQRLPQPAREEYGRSRWPFLILQPVLLPFVVLSFPLNSLPGTDKQPRFRAADRPSGEGRKEVTVRDSTRSPPAYPVTVKGVRIPFV